jgi:CysZ protein
MLKEIVIAIQAYFQAHRFIVKHRLWKWILIPGIIYAILFFAGIYFFGKSVNFTVDYLFSVTGLKQWMKALQSGWLSLLFIFGQVILHMVLLLFCFSLFKYLILIIGSPLFAYLSEKTEAIMEGNDLSFDFSLLIKDTIRGIKLALRNALWQTVYTMSIIILAFVPLAGAITPLMALLTECFYLGFSMLDYSCKRNNLSSSESIAFINKHKGLAIGNGMVFYLMHIVLIIGWVLAPSYSVIAATLSLYKSDSNNSASPDIHLQKIAL